MAPSANQLRVTDLEAAFEVEPNDAPAIGTPVTIPIAVHGVIAEAGDQDFFRFTAQKGQVLTANVFARRGLRSRLDALIAVRQLPGKQITSSDDNGGPDCFAEFTIPADGEYALLIRDHLRQGGPDYPYRIEIAPRQPSLVMRLPERQQYIPTTVSLPRANRMAVLVSAERRQFGEAVKIEVDPLPEGVTLQVPPIPPGRDRVPLLFHVSATASRGGHLLPLQGVAQVGDREIRGALDQRTMLVRGRNNVDVWGHNTDRMAVAITDEAPFSLEIVAPSVPLVRNGQMELRVIAHRKEGFVDPITVRMLYNPPGVSSRGSVTIPKDGSEVTMPLTANRNAAVGSSPIVVTGSAQFAGAAYEVSSQLVDLLIEDSLFKVAFDKSNVEQGQETDIKVTIERTREFEGTTRAELVGLPAGTSSLPIDVAPDAQELVFRVKAEPTARPGRFNTVLCRLVVTQNNEPIMQTLGTGQLRVDQPLTQESKTAATAKQSASTK